LVGVKRVGVLALAVGLFLCTPAQAVHRPWLPKAEARKAISAYWAPGERYVSRCHRLSRRAVRCYEKFWAQGPMEFDQGPQAYGWWDDDLTARLRHGRVWVISDIVGEWTAY
jgi:hypothetical protein